MEELQTPIQFVKGVGPNRAARLASRDIHTVADALFLLPRRYEDRRQVRTIGALRPGERASFTGVVLDFGIRRTGPRRRMFELLLGDDTGKITCRWFNFNPATLARRFTRGEQLRVAGKLEVYRGKRQLVHPDVEKISPDKDEGGEDFQSIIPVYPEIEGIYPKVLRRIMRRVVERFADKVVEVMPGDLRSRLGLVEVSTALHQVHFPGTDADLEELNRGRSPAHRRVVFEEFLLLQLGLALRRVRWKKDAGCLVPVRDDQVELARSLFGFELTGAQRRVLTELASDMASAQPMNRLLQGDVGSGKTALAILAALLAARADYQTAMMAPTEILAEQHFRNLKRLMKDGSHELEPAFLSSAVKGVERREVLEKIASGEVKLIVGTHSLFEEQVQFQNLGLCIIDEQHRFGVMQRARLRSKGRRPDVLVMTATPIPRTLAMTVYGDLDVSILDEMPPGRSPVKTLVLPGSQVHQAYQHVRREVQSGGQAYLVYPLVDESEKMGLLDATRMYKNLGQGVFSGLRLGLLHGRMSADEKERIMTSFSDGTLDVLVSTTVVEVGLDIPRATIMIVEHAERFGLSQLHQLRGRIGRGARPGTCYLIAHSLASEDARSRLKVMERTNDGFFIAEEDLAIRGPGEFLGTRQSGLPTFLFGDLARDSDLLALARQEAADLIEKDPDLSSSEHRALRRALDLRWGRRLQLAEVG